MSHKYSHVSTGGGFSVLNGSVKTPVINQDGTLNGSAVIDDASVTSAKLSANTVQYRSFSYSPLKSKLYTQLQLKLFLQLLERRLF